MSKAKRMAGSIRFMELWNMNYRHSKATDWGLGHVCVEQDFTILDVGCGGGRTLSKLATAATQGKVYGIDYSKESVAVTERTNARWVVMGRVEAPSLCVSASVSGWNVRSRDSRGDALLVARLGG
jgi:2-polyprenyl-3-methyl-5-hydroxy-6-metoxy-1,4-benzoquinol methylase